MQIIYMGGFAVLLAIQEIEASDSQCHSECHSSIAGKIQRIWTWICKRLPRHIFFLSTFFMLHFVCYPLTDHKGCKWASRSYEVSN